MQPFFVLPMRHHCTCQLQINFRFPLTDPLRRVLTGTALLWYNQDLNGIAFEAEGQDNAQNEYVG